MPKPTKTVLLKPKDYISTRESIEYSKANMPILRKRLPAHYSKPLRDILLQSGFDYSLDYIRSCVRKDSHHNIYVVRACEVLAKRLTKKAKSHTIVDVDKKNKRLRVKLTKQATE